MAAGAILASPAPVTAQLIADAPIGFEMRAAFGWAGTITDALL
jgi:hypothetical protein